VSFLAALIEPVPIMGGVYSRLFGKNVPIEMVLQELDKKLLEIEAYLASSRLSWRRYMFLLMCYSVILEVFYFLLYYFYLSNEYIRVPSNDHSLSLLWPKILYSSPFVLILLCTYALRCLLNFYYKKKLCYLENQVEELKAKQKCKLEEFVRTSNFYRTQELLNRYSRALQPSPSSQTEKTGLVQRRKSTADLSPFRTPPSHRNDSFSIPKEQHQKESYSKILQKQPIAQLSMPELQSSPVQTSTISRNNVQEGGIRFVMPVPQGYIGDNHAIDSSKQPQVFDHAKLAWYDKIIDYLVGPEYSSGRTGNSNSSGNSNNGNNNIDSNSGGSINNNTNTNTTTTTTNNNNQSNSDMNTFENRNSVIPLEENNLNSGNRSFVTENSETETEAKTQMDRVPEKTQIETKE